MIAAVTKAVGGRKQLFDLGFLGGSRALAALLGFLAVTLVARRLDAAELGIWGLALAVQGYVLQLGEFGLRSVVTAEAGRVPGRARYLLRRYLILRCGITAIAFASLLLVLAWFVTSDRATLVLVAFTAFIVALQLDWIDLAEGRMVAVAILQLARPFFFLMLLLFLPSIHTASNLAIVLMIAWALAVLGSWTALWRARPRRAERAPNSLHLLAMGWPIMLVAVLSQAQLSLDLIVVGWLMGTAAAGHYYLAAAIVTAGLVIANAVGQQTLARLASGEPDKAEIAERLRHRLALIALLTVPIVVVFAFIAPSLVPFFFGIEHQDASILIVWFIPWFVLQNITTVLQGGLIATRRQPELLRANLVMLLVTIPAIGLASMGQGLGWFALARAAGELARMISLVGFLNPLERDACLKNIWLTLVFGSAVTIGMILSE